MPEHSWEQVGRECGDDSNGDSERTRFESLPHGFEKQCFVQDPERLLMRLPSKGGEEDAAALALDQRPAERCLQFANLERERRLRDVNALRRRG